MLRACFLFVLTFVFSIYSLSVSWALNVQSLKPQNRKNQGLSLITSEALDQNQYTFGATFNWDHNPLETGTPTNRNAGIVDDFVTANILAGYGLTSWLSVNVDVPVNLYHNIGPVFIAARDQSGGDLGDISLSTPMTFYNANNTQNNWGLALVPFITFPTGEVSTYFGDDTITGGATIVGDKLFGDNRLYLNLGTRFRSTESVGANLGVNHEMTYGLGYQRPLVKKWNLDVLGEVSGSSTFDDLFSQDTDVPLEAHVALRKNYLDNSLALTVGGGKGITSGYGAPDFRGFLGISYTGKVAKKTRPIAPEEPTVILFDFDKSIVKSQYQDDIAKIAAKWQKNPSLQINVVGHTDYMGSNSYNDKLSARRAHSVKKSIVKQGVDKNSVQVSFYGENKPVATNAEANGRQLNRRVEVLWIVVK